MIPLIGAGVITALFCVNKRTPFAVIHVAAVYALLVAAELVLGMSRASDPRGRSETYIAAAIIFGGLLACGVGYKLAAWLPRGGSSPQQQSPVAPMFRSWPAWAWWLGLAMTGISLAGWTVALNSLGTTGVLLSATSDRYLPDTPLWVDLAMNAGSAGVALVFMASRNTKERLVAAAISLPHVLPAVLLSRRSLLLPLVLTPLLLVYAAGWRPRWRNALTAVSVLLTLSVLLMWIRFSASHGLANDVGGRSTALRLALESHVREATPLVEVVSRSSSLGGTEWVWRGWTAWSTLLVPRAIVSDKPAFHPTDKHVARHFFRSRDLRHGMPATILGTFYLGGGIAFVGLGMLAIGILARLVDQLALRERASPAEVVFFAASWQLFAVYLFRLGDLSAAVSQAIIAFMPLVTAAWLLGTGEWLRRRSTAADRESSGGAVPRRA